ncbi:unnamed protein product, partial [Brassica oleracea var. botrytis]
LIDSVRELVERGMEVGLVRRAFGDSGTTVKKQLTCLSRVCFGGFKKSKA